MLQELEKSVNNVRKSSDCFTAQFPDSAACKNRNNGAIFTFVSDDTSLSGNCLSFFFRNKGKKRVNVPAEKMKCESEETREEEGWGRG